MVVSLFSITAFAAEEDPTVSIDMPETFTVGQPIEFTISTTAGKLANTNTMVIGTSDFNGADAIEKLEYYEVQDGNWCELQGSSFGPSFGFPLSDSTSRFRVTFKEAGEFQMTVKVQKVNGDVLASASATIKSTLAVPTLSITDCGHFTTADWGGEAGVFSLGWQYSNFDMDTVSSIRVGMKDAKGRTVMEYTADKEQIAWQLNNGYVTDAGLSSAPFYKEYKGTPITEGRDDDWTVAKGDGFNAWQPTLFYVELIADGTAYHEEAVCKYDYPHIHENVIAVPAKSAAEGVEGNIAYWYCKDCEKYFEDEALTEEISKEDTIIAALPHTTHTGGIATCKDQAICTVCGKPYGKLDPSNHAGDVEVRSAKEATCTAEGYTGDTYCLGCDAKIADGKTIAKAAHQYQDGKCIVCNAADPNFKPDATPTPTPASEATPTPVPEATPSPDVTTTPAPEQPENNVPKTGDETNVLIWIAVTSISGALLTGSAIFSKSRKQKP